MRVDLIKCYEFKIEIFTTYRKLIINGILTICLFPYKLNLNLLNNNHTNKCPEILKLT